MPIAIAPWFVKEMIVVLEMDVKPGQNVMEQIVVPVRTVDQEEVAQVIIAVSVLIVDRELNVTDQTVVPVPTVNPE